MRFCFSVGSSWVLFCKYINFTIFFVCFWVDSNFAKFIWSGGTTTFWTVLLKYFYVVLRKYKFYDFCSTIFLTFLGPWEPLIGVFRFHNHPESSAIIQNHPESLGIFQVFQVFQVTLNFSRYSLIFIHCPSVEAKWDR